MKLYLWRHNRKFHSYSMIEEPVVHQDFYTSAIAVIMAESLEQALELLQAQDTGWRIEDLRLLTPLILECTEPGVVYQAVYGS
jgi:hypothetical protein